MTPNEIKKFIVGLHRLGERQFKRETLARYMIEERLTRECISYTTEEFSTFLPRVEEAVLKIDGRPVPCVATSFVSGIIKTPNHLISSLTSSQNFIQTENINFNPFFNKPF